MSTMKKQFIGECSKLRIVELTDYLRFHMYFSSPANIVSFLFMAGESKKLNMRITRGIISQTFLNGLFFVCCNLFFQVSLLFLLLLVSYMSIYYLLLAKG